MQSLTQNKKITISNSGYGKGYKLFEQKNDKLYPLFIDKNTPIPVDTWLTAENHTTKDFAPRPGWHIGEIPDAPWLKGYDGTDKGIYKSRFKHGKRVWCEVEYMKNIDYTNVAERNPKHCLPDTVPLGGIINSRKQPTAFG